MTPLGGEVFSSLASSSYWDSVWSSRKLQENFDIQFRDTLSRCLPYDEKLSCIELGCIPGSYLVFMKENFGYRIHGIDYSNNVDTLHETMSSNGISDYQFYRADVRTWTPPMKFDIVCSFGLIEHFSSPGRIIEKHIEMMNANGFLVLEVPNFRYGQYLLHLLLDNENLLRHNTDAMRKEYVEDILQSRGLKIVYSGYEGDFSYWEEPQERNIVQVLAAKGIRALTPPIRRLMGRSRNRFVSPFLVWIAKS